MMVRQTTKETSILALQTSYASKSFQWQIVTRSSSFEDHNPGIKTDFCGNANVRLNMYHSICKWRQRRSNITNDITRGTAVIVAKYKSEAETKNDTPYLSVTDEL